MKIQSLIKFSVLLATTATIAFSPIGARYTIDTAYAKTVQTEDGRSFEVADWVTKYKDASEEEYISWSKENVTEAQKTCKIQNSYFLYDSGMEKQVRPYNFNNKEKDCKEGVYAYSNCYYNMVELMSYGFKYADGRTLAKGLYGTMLIDGKEYYSGSDITSKIISATSTKNYHDNRKNYYYTAGLMDTYENATKMKSTIFYFTAPYNGQIKFRTIEPLKLRIVNTPLLGYGVCETAFEIYDVETGKSISTENATATNDVDTTDVKIYFAGDIVKGKKYAIVINSAGASNVSEIEMFFMKYYNVDSKYKKDTWYTRTLPTIANRQSAKDTKKNCIKINLAKKSKVTIYLKNLGAYEEETSSILKNYVVYSGKDLDKGKFSISASLRSRIGVDIGNDLGKFTFTLDKGYYYFPIDNLKGLYDVTFKYTVTPVK